MSIGNYKEIKMNDYKTQRIIYYAFVALCIICQFYLTSKKKLEYGLILPAIFFVPSLVVLISYFISYGTFGFAVNFKIFLLQNIPTLILLLIYFYKMGEKKKKKEVDKMKINDL